MPLGLPRTVVVLGFVSLLADVAGEMVQPLLPLYLVAIGAGAAAVGAVEGAAEAAVSLVKAASGRVADKLPRRKPLVALGYGLAAVAKPSLALALAWPQALALRAADRVGKGVRGPPRDAMIGDAAPPGKRGLAFGFHRAADTTGAIVGPLVAIALLAWLGQGPEAMRVVFALTALPMLAGVLLLVLGVRESPRSRSVAARGAAGLPRAFWGFLAVASFFALATVLYAFMLLRAQQLGASVSGAVALYLLFNVVYAGASIPLGSLSDRVGRGPVLAAGFGVFALVNAGFALAPTTLAWAVPLFALYGLFMASFEGVARALAVDLAPPAARATALGYYHAAVGLGALPLGLAVGFAWERLGAREAFGFAALLALGVALALAVLSRWERRARPPQRAATGGAP